MRFAPTAWRLAGWRLPHPPRPHRRHQLPAGRSRVAGGLSVATIEGRIAGRGLLASSNIAALRTEKKALSGTLQFPSLDNRTVHAGYVRVTSWLDAIHHDIDIGHIRVAGDFRRQRRVRPRRRRVPARPGRSFAGGPRSLTRRS
jgi:hypothetical protein